MKINEIIKPLLIPIKKVNFKMYSLESSSGIIEGKRFYLTELQAKDISANNLKNIYWEFNNKTFGEYCRDAVLQISKIENELGGLRLRIDFHEIEQHIPDLIISELEGIIQNDSQIKRSIYIDSESLFETIQENSIKTFQKTSVDRIFDFRKQRLTALIHRIQNGLMYSYHVPKSYTKKKISTDQQIEHKRRDTNEIEFKRVERIENKTLGTNGFCWNKKRDLIKDTVILHTYLREHEFIHKETPINLLKSAFSCKFLSFPLEIRWTKKVKGKDSKGLLFHFIEQLEHLDFINIIYQNSELFNKLEVIFCDSSGDNLENLAVSKSQWLNQRRLEKTPQEIELDRILYTLLYSDSNKSIN